MTLTFLIGKIVIVRPRGRPPKAKKQKVAFCPTVKPELVPTPDALIKSNFVAHIRKRRVARGRRVPQGDWVVKDFLGIWPFLYLHWEDPEWESSFEPACNLDHPDNAIKRAFEKMKKDKIWFTPIWEPYINGFKEVFGCIHCFDLPINC